MRADLNCPVVRSTPLTRSTNTQGAYVHTPILRAPPVRRSSGLREHLPVSIGRRLHVLIFPDQYAAKVDLAGGPDTIWWGGGSPSTSSPSSPPRHPTQCPYPSPWRINSQLVRQGASFREVVGHVISVRTPEAGRASLACPMQGADNGKNNDLFPPASGRARQGFPPASHCVRPVLRNWGVPHQVLFPYLTV